MTYARILDCIFYCTQHIISYVLMLVVMSFSAWLFIAVILGLTVGNAVFFYRPTANIFKPKKELFQVPRSYDAMAPCDRHGSINQDEAFEAIPDSDPQESESRNNRQPTNENVISVEVHNYD